ncbi:MAG: hypothetical protein ABI405_06285, partial [Parafilimonas sp.]
MEMTIKFYHTPFLGALLSLPENTIVFSEGKQQLFAGALYKNSIALAHGLREKGFQEKDRMVIIVPP